MKIKKKKKVNLLVKQELLYLQERLRPTLIHQRVPKEVRQIYFMKDKVYCFNEGSLVAVNMNTGLTVAVPGNSFFDIIERIPDTAKGEEEVVDIKLSGGELLIRGKGFLFKLPTGEMSDVRNLLETTHKTLDTIKFRKLPDDFVEGVSNCLFSTGHDIANLGLSCIYCEGETITSSDNQRVSQFTTSSKIYKPFLLHHEAAEDMIRFFSEEATHYSVQKTGTYFTFKGSGDIYFARKIDLNYPNSDKMLEFKGKKVKLPSFLKQSINLVSVVLEDEPYKKRVLVAITGDVIKIYGAGDKTGVSGYQEIPFDNTKGIEKRFLMNPDYLRAILSKTTTAKFGKDKILFTQKNFKHLLGILYHEKPKSSEEKE